MRTRVWFSVCGVVSLWFLLNLSFAAQMVAAARGEPCEGSLKPLLTIGGFGRVTRGNSNNVRDIPAKTGKLVGKLPGGESFEVLDGPKCVDGFNWWKVHTSDFDGWTVESDGTIYWLLPYAPKFKVTTQDNITHVQYTDASSISFDFDSSLAKSVDYDFRITDWTTQSPLPESICFQFRIEPPQRFPFNELCVFITQGMDYHVRTLDETLTRIKGQEADKPTHIIIPYNGAAQLILARQHYFDTDMLRGVGFLTYYAQDDFPITNDEGFQYNYTGLTQDGKFIIYFAYVVSSPLVPYGKPSQALIYTAQSNSSEYYRGVTDLLNAASPADFTPNLQALDALINSLKIE